MPYGAKYYQLMGDHYGAAQGDFLGLGKVVKKVAAVVSRVAAPIKAIPGIGPVLAKVAPKFIPGVGIVSTAMMVGGLAKKGLQVARQFRGFPVPGPATAKMAVRGMTRPAVISGIGGAAVGAGAGALAPTPGGYGGMSRAIQEGRAAVDPESGRVVSTRTGRSYRRYRRINPMKARAARRAIRRIKAVRKIVRQIESSLPKARSTMRSYMPYRRRRKAA